MASDATIALAWAARAVPLTPRAVVAIGAPARALGRRLAALADAELAALTAVAGPAALVILGDAAALPWVDGVIYVGRDDAAPGLLLPTTLAPTVAAPVVARAVAAWLGARGAAVAWPVALVPTPLAIIPCGAARPIERGRLAAWLEAA